MIIFPSSFFPVTAGKCVEGFYSDLGGTQEVHARGLGFIAALDADAIWRLIFNMPADLGGGTPRFCLDALANATSGVAKLNPKWKAFNADADLISAAVSAEGLTADVKTGGGATDTIQWEAGDDTRVLHREWTLNATTAPTANQRVLLDLTGETSGWTLATILCLIPYIRVA